jgi:hypothetical protein
MATTQIKGAAEAAPTFDAALWLHTFAQAGGGYALAAERKLWLVVDPIPVHMLTPLMAAIVGKADRQEALRTLIERRQLGEA